LGNVSAPMAESKRALNRDGGSPSSAPNQLSRFRLNPMWSRVGASTAQMRLSEALFTSIRARWWAAPAAGDPPAVPRTWSPGKGRPA